MAGIVAVVWDGYRAAMRMAFRFSGRSSCEALWTFVVALIGLSLLAFVLDQAVGLVWHRFIGFRFVVRLVHVVPYMALLARRMHDIDRSGWSVVSPRAMLKALFESGTPGPNRFGAPPGADGAVDGPTIR